MKREVNGFRKARFAISSQRLGIRLVTHLGDSALCRKGTLGLERQHRYIVATREIALKMAKKMLRAWSAPLDRDECQSLVDLALVKAARCYRPEGGSRFTSYMYFFLHGELTRAIGRAVRDGRTLSLEQTIDFRKIETGSDGESGDSQRCGYQEEFLDGTSSPEHQAYLSEIRLCCRNAFAKLTHFEQRVVEAVHINGLQVTAAARRLGFSRGHVSKTRTDALRKLRPDLYMLRPAA